MDSYSTYEDTIDRLNQLVMRQQSELRSLQTRLDAAEDDVAFLTVQLTGAWDRLELVTRRRQTAEDERALLLARLRDLEGEE